MAWRRIGDKPLSEPMFTRFTDAYMRDELLFLNLEMNVLCRCVVMKLSLHPMDNIYANNLL